MSVSVWRRASLVAAWSTAALRGTVPAGLANEVLAAGSVAPTFVGPEPGDRYGLDEALGRWRHADITGWRYVPLVPGDAGSLPGPGSFSAVAIESAVALVSWSGTPLGMYPATPDAATWRVSATDGHGRTPPESLADADRALLASLTGVTEQLETMAVSAWAGATSTDEAGAPTDDPMPPGFGMRAERLAARSCRVLGLIETALDSAGGSRTSGQVQAREAALRDLARTARAAHALAWNESLRGPAPAPSAR